MSGATSESGGVHAADLADRAQQRRRAGDLRTAHTAYLVAFDRAREDGDIETMIRIALALPSVQGFGAHPGSIPALIHEVYSIPAPDPVRARLAAALARAWAYGGESDRAARYAREARLLAEGSTDPQVVADVLDAELLGSWGPDLRGRRADLASRLADVAAHQTDTETQLSAFCWRLTTAWEALDTVTVQRQLRALDLLAEESGSPRVAFFAAARRAMYLLTTSELETAESLIRTAETMGDLAGEPDAYAIRHTLRSELAVLRGDHEAIRVEAEIFEEYADSEGIQSVVAQAAVLRIAAGDMGRAALLRDRLAGAGRVTIPPDVDFLLTGACLLRLATALADTDLAAHLVQVLSPYADHVVLNAGAVTFHGVMAAHLAGAQHLLGADDRQLRDRAAAAYRRIGARWWLEQIGADRGPDAPGSIAWARGAAAASRPGDDDLADADPLRQVSTAAAGPGMLPMRIRLVRSRTGSWEVGPPGATVLLPDLRGLHHLHTLLANPGVGIPARVLTGSASGPAAATVVESGTELLDSQALSAYRRRLDRIADEMLSADAAGDASRSEELTNERAAIVEQLRQATGLGGRRRLVGSTAERARVAVRKAISAALDRVELADPAVARLLRDCITTGSVCRYEPDPQRPVQWELSTRRSPGPAQVPRGAAGG